MLVSEAMKRIRYRINDDSKTGYLDDVLINYINDSIKYLSHALIARNDPILINELRVSKNIENKVPDNFVRFAGGFPVVKKGKRFFLADDESDYVNTKYFSIPREVASDSDELPFEGNDTYHSIIIDLAVIYALNQHEWNVERDTAMRQELEQIVTQGLGEGG